MESLLKRVMRDVRRHKIASWTFAAAISLLYLANLAIRIFVFEDSAWELVCNFLFPPVVAFCFWGLDRMYRVSTRLFGIYIPKFKILALCAPAIAALLSIMACGHTYDWVDFNIILLGAGSMCLTVYALSNAQHASIAIVVQAAGFVWLAARLDYNTAAMVSIPAIALVLLFCIPMWHRKDYSRWQHWVTAALSAVALLSIFFLLLILEETQVRNAFWIASMGRPGLGSTTWVAQECSRMLTEARFVGAVPLDYDPANIFSHRVLAYILSQGGWLALIPVLLALILMISSGIYLCHRNMTFGYFASVASMAVIAFQTVGYLLTCIGWDELVFCEISPFLDGGYLVNTVFFMMALCILSPRLKFLTD